MNTKCTTYSSWSILCKQYYDNILTCIVPQVNHQVCHQSAAVYLSISDSKGYEIADSSATESSSEIELSEKQQLVFLSLYFLTFHCFP